MRITAFMQNENSVLGQALWLIRRMHSRFALVLGTNLLAAITDAVGISLMLPAIQLAAIKDKEPTGITVYLAQAFRIVGLEFSFASVLILMVAVFLFKFVLVSSANIIQAWLLLGMRESFRARIVKDLALADWSFVARQNQSRFINLFVSEVDSVIGSAKTLVSFLSTSAFITAFLSASFFASWQLTLMTLVMAGLLAIPFALIGQLSKKLSANLTAKNLSSYHFFGMMLGALKYLKATNNTGALVKLADREIGLRKQMAFKMNMITVLTSAATEPVVVLFVCSFAIIATTVFAHDPADIILPLLFLYRTGSRVVTAQRAGVGFSNGVGAIAALRRGLAEVGEAARPKGGADPGKLTTAIGLRSVSYRIGDARILSDVTMQVEAGGMVGLVGETGAGKTTLIDHICGLVAPTEGTVTWNGQPYSGLDLHRLRSRVGYITQEPVVMNDTVMNNITLWEDNPDLRKVTAAAQSAHAMEFIERMPDKFESMVGDQGMRLSGGQRQRLALARELYRDTEVLIVDEGTSALDSETEDMIQTSLAALKGRKTVIMIAHRLSTLRQCDRIIVLNHGRITAQGTWDELSAKDAEWFGRALLRQGGSLA